MDVVKEVGFHFQTNDTPDYNPGIVWEAHKAVIQGVLIKHGLRVKQEREEKLQSLVVDIHTLEPCHKHAPSLKK